ncbi:MAG: DUF5107 domain-containing protein [Lachnospiraceae bacterium]
MKPTLQFKKIEIPMSDLGPCSSVPDLLGEQMLQNHLSFELDETDEIYEGYGKRKTAFPYAQQNTYTRKLTTKTLVTAVLENRYLTAIFLPELGGRLWKLIDKRSGDNLIYTNDVIRFSNLAVRNAWFSGGVEWNMGIIGHSPFTNAQLFTATLENAEGNPVLRMYEYERVRQAEYQMDFWLGEEDLFLNCRMRITNANSQVVPMYWWSNIAVPEYKGGRIAVPAKKAYTSQKGKVYKVDVPKVKGTDISHYNDIPNQIDYFFEIPKEEPKYIAHVDENGKGLLHVSTSRLQSRKLFSWGNNQGSKRWQGFLTEQAGPYVEIQAGLGKTQYGCIPMAPNSAWEWVEQYGPIQVGPEKVQAPYEDFLKEVHETAQKQANGLQELLENTKNMAKSKAILQLIGSGYGAFESAYRKEMEQSSLTEHLDYGTCKGMYSQWFQFLTTGILHEPSIKEIPDTFMCDEKFYEKLKETIKGVNRENWYAHYQLGILCLERKKDGKANKYLNQSNHLKENPWAHHGLAVLELGKGRLEKAIFHIQSGLKFRKEDASYVKESFHILLLAKGYKELIKQYEKLSQTIRLESRIYYDYICALSKIGKTQKAFTLLCENENFEVEDLREGEDSISQLWNTLYTKLYQEEGNLPDQFNFDSL